MPRARHQGLRDETMMRPAAQDPPSWSTPFEALMLFLRGATAPTAWRVAVIVGVLLSAVNQGAIVLAGAATSVTWVRVAFNFLVPYVVASIGFLSACRDTADRPRQ